MSYKMKKNLPLGLQSCLDGLKRDREAGIVLVDEGKTIREYRAELEEQEKSGIPKVQSWQAIEDRLLDKNEALLKAAYELPRRRLVGECPGGELAIRAGEGHKVRWTRRSGGELAVVSAYDALYQGGPWATHEEIFAAVRQRKLQVAPAPRDKEKRGLVAAFEAVTGKFYTGDPEIREFSYSVLDGEGSMGKVVAFTPGYMGSREGGSIMFTAIQDSPKDTANATMEVALWVIG
jgi:hypothetical protein